jgi:hypothetical protein
MLSIFNSLRKWGNMHSKGVVLLFIVIMICNLNLLGQDLSNDTILPVPYKLDTLNIKALSLKRLPYSSKFLKYITVKRINENKSFKTPEESVKSFLKYEGKKIRNIDIQILKPFGPKICDTCGIAKNWFEKLANTLHYPTRTKYLKRLLTVESGDTIVPLEIADNERLIRELSHINDAVIFIKPVEGNEDYVDINLICEDVFSWAFEVNTDFNSDFGVEAYNKNLFGKGHQIFSSFAFEDDKKPKWGYSFGYGIENIARSYITLGLSYTDNFEGRRLRFDVKRDFVTSDTKWAGGLLVEHAKDAHKLRKEDKIETEESLDFVNIDTWLAYSHKLESNKYVRKNLIFSLGYYSAFFSKRPEIKLDSTLFFIDRSYIISSISLSKRRYYKTNFVYDLGKTEDIPKGYYSCLILGYEDNNLGRYLYTGIAFNKTWFSKLSFEYFGTSLRVGSFYNIDDKNNRGDKSNFERGVVDLRLNSITKLYKLNRSRLRFYADLKYTIGFLRYPSDYIDLNDQIRGFRSKLVRGNQKLSLALTQNIFLPYVVNGYRFSLFTFTDVGVIGSNDDWVFNKDKYWGLGFGIKLNNDNLIFKTFSLRFAYYPTIPNDFRKVEVIIRGEKPAGFVNLDPEKPQIIGYK